MAGEVRHSSPSFFPLSFCLFDKFSLYNQGWPQSHSPHCGWFVIVTVSVSVVVVVVNVLRQGLTM